MKAKFQKRTGGYTPELASNILDSSKPIHSLSVELEPQIKFVDKKPTDEILGYKAWFIQSGLPPFEVKFENQIKLPLYLSVITFDDIQACEVSYNIYFRANDIKEVK